MAHNRPLKPLNCSPTNKSRGAVSDNSQDEDERLKISVKVSDRETNSRLSSVQYALGAVTPSQGRDVSKLKLKRLSLDPISNRNVAK